MDSLELYLESIGLNAKIKPFKEYNEFAQKTELIVIEANQDEILSKVDLKDLNSKIKLMSLDGNHGFSEKQEKI